MPPLPAPRTPAPSPRAPAEFAPLAVPGARVWPAKALFVALNLVGLGVVLWKVRAMGLLPLTSADWVSLIPDRLPIVGASGAVGV